MREIIDTEQVLGVQSEFTIDLVKGDNGGLTVDVFQSNDGSRNYLSNIPISDLTLLISKLQYFYSLMNVAKPTDAAHINKVRGKQIIEYYFKNIEIHQIAKLLNIPKSVVENELKEKGIEIVSLKPKAYWKNKGRNKKKNKK